MTDDLEARAGELAGGHYLSEDCWYSCPLSSEGCCNDAKPKNVCDCGHEQRVQQIAAALREERRRVWMEACKILDEDSKLIAPDEDAHSRCIQKLAQQARDEKETP